MIDSSQTNAPERLTVVIGLGGNIPPRRDWLLRAIAAIRQLEPIQIRAASPVYETPPWGYADQGPFLNAAILIRTDWTPTNLMPQLLEVESGLGRRRSSGAPQWGPRPIDLDILFIPDQILISPNLTIPHPRLTERAFALKPLLDLLPDAADPRTGRPFQRDLEQLDLSEMTPVADSRWLLESHGTVK